MPEPHELSRLKILSYRDADHPLHEQHRLIDVDAEQGVAYLFRMKRPWKRLVRASWRKVVDDFDAAQIDLTTFESPAPILLDDNHLSDSCLKIRDKWWNLLGPYLMDSLRYDLYESPGAIIAGLAKRVGLTKASLYQAIYRYYYYGLIPNAFLPRFDLRGGRGRMRAAGVAKRGRPRKACLIGHSDAQGINMTSDEIARVNWALDEFYTVGKHATFASAYRSMIGRYYMDPSAARNPEDPDDHLVQKRPTLRQFIYTAKRRPDLKEILRKRIGAKKWDKNFRAVIGRSSAEVIGPTDRYQIDATVGDVYLVSSYNRNWIIGRPVIYVVVDVFSGYIVGLYVGLEGPSWEGARLALLNAFTDKSAFLERYGMQLKEPWMARHLCADVFADRAELLSENANGLVTGLGVTVSIASGYRPDWKGIVEQKFNILNGLVVHFVPGAVVQRNRERGQRDYALDGSLTLREFTRMIIRAVAFFNEHHITHDRATSEMIRLGVGRTPAALWRFGMEHLIGGTVQRTEEEIYAHLLPQATATVREDGIYFSGLRYSSRYAMDQNWFERARSQGRFRVDVRFHTETPQRIWLIGRSDSLGRVDAHEASLLDPYGRYDSKRWEEASDLIQFEALQEDEAKQQGLEARMNMDAANRREIDEAKRDKASHAEQTSKAKARGQIKANRSFEKSVERAAQAREEATRYGVLTIQPGATSQEAPKRPALTRIEAKIRSIVLDREGSQP